MLLTDPTYDIQQIGYLAANYGIFFSILIIFCIIIMLMLCCCIGCFKNDTSMNKNNRYFEEYFEIIPYTKIHTFDRTNIISTIKKENKKNKFFGLDKKLDVKNKENKTLKNINNCNIAGIIVPQTNNIKLKDDENKQDSIVNINTNINKTQEEKKIYLCYTFDNLDNKDSTTNIFRDLETFVSVILKTMDPKEVSVILKISSPGGYAYMFELAYTQILRLKNKGFELIAVIDDICASGGYMLASACSKIICSEYAQIGSVGVCATMHNYYELSQKIGITEKTLTTGLYKRPFPTGEPFYKEHVDRVMESIDESLNVFKDIVQKSRKLSDDEMSVVLSAKVWYGKQAMDIKLIDLIMYSDDFLENLIKENEDNQIYLICRSKSNSKLNPIAQIFLNMMSRFTGAHFDSLINIIQKTSSASYEFMNKNYSNDYLKSKTL